MGGGGGGGGGQLKGQNWDWILPIFTGKMALGSLGLGIANKQWDWDLGQ